MRDRTSIPRDPDVVVLKPIMPGRPEPVSPPLRPRSYHYEYRQARRWMWRVVWISALIFLYSHRHEAPQYLKKIAAMLPARRAAVEVPATAPLPPPQAPVGPAPPVPLQLRAHGPPAEKSWPRGVSLPDTPAIIVIKEDADAQNFVYRSPPFEFRSDTRLGPDALREFARVFKATYLVNCLLPLDIRPAPEMDRDLFVVLIFQNESDYWAAGGMKGSSGTYMGNKKAILVPLQSLGVKVVNNRVQTERSGDNEVLIHEATHQMMNAWLPRLPVWFTEGSAEYVAMADYLHGRFYLSQMQSRLENYLRARGKKGRSFEIMSPYDLMKMDQEGWNHTLAANSREAGANYASAAVLTYYFYHLDGEGDGAGIIAYLRDIEKNRPQPEAASEHLLRGRTPEQFEESMLKAFASRGMHFTLAASSRPRLLKHLE